MMQAIRFISVLAFIFLLGGCQAQSNSTAVIEVIPKATFQEKLAAEENVQLIDVRTAQEIVAGKIENAQHLDLLDGSFEAAINTLDPERAVFVYCASGGRSNRAAKMLEKNGFKKVYDLKGGYKSW